MTNQTISRSEFREMIEKIMDEETTHLTKTGDANFNPPEIIDFDTVVMNKFEATNKLVALFQSQINKARIEEGERIIDKIGKKMLKLVDVDGYVDTEDLGKYLDSLTSPQVKD